MSGEPLASRRGHVAALLAVLACASACHEPPSEGEPCSGPGGCGKDLVCCSTDPSALDLSDLSANVLPIYPGHNPVGGEALFSDAANDRSQRGLCVRPGSVPPAGALDNGCPVPCNPTWSKLDIQTVCGEGSLCCQSTELEPEDCVLDPGLGEAGCWRPVTGADIGTLTSWAVDEHATHQDPGLLADGACASLVAGLPGNVDAEAVRDACTRRLTVANQRGYCLSAEGNSCLSAQPGYRDACDELNDNELRSGCSP